MESPTSALKTLEGVENAVWADFFIFRRCALAIECAFCESAV